MFCSKCGKEIPDDSAFCPFCGEPTKKVEPERTVPTESVQQGAPIEKVPKKYSIKAIISLILLILVFLAATEETTDYETALGSLVFSIVALVLALLSLKDIKQDKVKGRILAWIDLTLSIICVMASIGWMME